MQPPEFVYESRYPKGLGTGLLAAALVLGLFGLIGVLSGRLLPFAMGGASSAVFALAGRKIRRQGDAPMGRVEFFAEYADIYPHGVPRLRFYYSSVVRIVRRDSPNRVLILLKEGGADEVSGMTFANFSELDSVLCSQLERRGYEFQQY